MARSSARRSADGRGNQATLALITLVAAAVAALGIFMELDWLFFVVLAVVLVVGLIWGRGHTPARRELP
jgi:hypothetical protein